MSESSTAAETGRKRRRAARACRWCRAKKYRCDEEQPCHQCQRWNVSCEYEGAERLKTRQASQIIYQHNFTQELLTTSESADVSNKVFSSPTRQLRPSQRQSPDSHSGRIGGFRSSINRPDVSDEVDEVNTHTLNNEFHGPTSSLAFLATIQRQNRNQARSNVDQLPPSEDQPSSLVSTFHNEIFSPTSAAYTTTEWQKLSANSFYFRQSQLFLNGYFQNLHYIHPIVDRVKFFSRCENIWFDRPSNPSKSFIALYYSIMSLGALTREWDEESLDTTNRFDWARKMFTLASMAIGEFPGRSDPESVQAYIIMAKICQNELNPNLAYMYLGHAIRTSFSAGYNRHPSTEGAHHQEISRTWWALYSLEMETSFALGRPDSLGDDIYHTRQLPAIDGSPTMLINCMVDLAKIIKKVSYSVYLSGENITQKVMIAGQLETELENWLSALPQIIRPPSLDSMGDETSLKSNIPAWANRQSHTLRFRYYNVKMVLYRPFLLYLGHRATHTPGHFDSAVAKCVSAATKTIELMHHMFCHYSYFRTWWYNTTYTLYAASIIVFYAQKVASPPEISGLLRLVEMSVDVLKTMNDNVVAKKAAATITKASLRIREERSFNNEAAPIDEPGSTTQDSLATNAEGGVPDLFDETMYDPFDQDQLDFMTRLFPLSVDSDFTWDDRADAT
ncbi:hypothetical protein LTR84_007248 [Exophiala bonariae]|uniref:Zn(2)-C6 fungal-type domain-containing protein n=1 Tax=Exophiala bonariae TaxID=1690606 RepID=A0AAV9N1Z8_9EURO|nr:hypothetical protein LTR84_007248 [Exophiala bonariae]